jgi:chromosome segregation ATPase
MWQEAWRLSTVPAQEPLSELRLIRRATKQEFRIVDSEGGEHYIVPLTAKDANDFSAAQSRISELESRAELAEQAHVSVAEERDFLRERVAELEAKLQQQALEYLSLSGQQDEALRQLEEAKKALRGARETLSSATGFMSRRLRDGCPRLIREIDAAIGEPT